MALTWNDDVAKIKIHANYTSVNSKLDDISTSISNKGCDSSIANAIKAKIAAMKAAVDALVGKALHTMSKVADLFTSVSNCIVPLLPDTHENFMSNLTGAINGIGNGAILNSITSKIDGVISNIEDAACDALESLLKGIMDEITKIETALANFLDHVVKIDLMNVQFGLNFGKIAGLLNCAANALAKADDTFGGNLEAASPALSGIASKLTSNVSLIGKQGAMDKAKGQLAQNMGIESMHANFNTAFALLFS